MSLDESERRGKMEILASVLKAAMRENKPTRIMYRSNLSWDRLLLCLEVLVRRGCLEKRATDGSTVYDITSRGYRAVFHYDIFAKIILGETK
jgi:predicted transcriptional regulator